MNKLKEVTDRIKQLRSSQETILIAVDGYGGSGKSSVAKLIQDDFPNSIIVEMDDFYSPEFKRADFKRVLEQVIKPLKNNQIASYQIYDWQNDKLIDTKPLPPKNIIIFEGVYSLTEELIDNYDIKIWIEYPSEEGFKRGLQRDKNQYGVDTTDKWLVDWMPREKQYIESQKPDKKADFIMDGSNVS